MLAAAQCKKQSVHTTLMVLQGTLGTLITQIKAWLIKTPLTVSNITPHFYTTFLQCSRSSSC